MTTPESSRADAAYGPEDFAAEFGISRETLARLTTYAALLAQWQKAVNLVAPSTLNDVWRRHFADSAQLLALAPSHPAAWLDLGSGAGFPGLVVAILLAGRSRPTAPESPGNHDCPGNQDDNGEAAVRVTLVESDQRKAAFLREVARQTGVTVDILAIRIENLATRFKLPRGGVVSARALASLTGLLRLASPCLSGGSVGLFLKGREAESEVAEARRAWRFDARLVPSVTDPASRVVVVRDFEGPCLASDSPPPKMKR